MPSSSAGLRRLPAMRPPPPTPHNGSSSRAKRPPYGFAPFFWESVTVCVFITVSARAFLEYRLVSVQKSRVQRKTDEGEEVKQGSGISFLQW
jgi:hypothetical protein